MTNKLTAITTVVDGFTFSCHSPSLIYEGETFKSTAYDMTEEYERNRTDVQEYPEGILPLLKEFTSCAPCDLPKSHPEYMPKGEYVCDTYVMLDELCKLWFRCFEEYWNDCVKEFDIGGKILMAYSKFGEDPDWGANWAELAWHMNVKAVKWLVNFCEKNRRDFGNFLKLAHGPRSGFKPNAPYTVDDWFHWMTGEINEQEYKKSIHLAIARGYDFVLFGQKDGKFTEETLEKRQNRFLNRYWLPSYDGSGGDDEWDDPGDMNGWMEVEGKCIIFVPEDEGERSAA